MATNINDMAAFLPEYVTIAKTPDWRWNSSTTDVTIETVELKTKDVIAVFMEMQHRALQEARKIRDQERRMLAMERIRRMVFFDA